MKILINTPQINKLGGVANHYLGLKPYWKENVYYNTIGSRNTISGSIIFPFDVFKFIIKCIFNRPNLVILNPSLNKKSLKRDALYLKISKILRRKTFVFFHGWNTDIEMNINPNPSSFLRMYNNADGFFVLADSFSITMQKWGIDKPIYLTTTKVNDALLEDFSISEKEFTEPNILFLSRIEKEKGIFTALETFKLVVNKIPHAKLTVVGDGKALSDAKIFVKKNEIINVEFTGALQGEKLINVFKSHTVYLFPTQHGEGMPTSVLEAMAFGMPIISRPVGGLKDFFIEGKMGYLIESTEPKDFSEKIINLLEDNYLLSKVGTYNNYYAKEHFIASKVCKNLESIFNSN